MNKSPGDSEARWENLLRQAQPDTAPSVNVPALLRAVRLAAAEPRRGWAGDFLALCGSARVAASCLAGAAAFALLASWQAWTLWEVMPWVQLVATTTGGAP
jgi:hypothetical protein